MSSNFWHIDKLDSEAKKIRERFDSGSCATNCICIFGASSSFYFELSEVRCSQDVWVMIDEKSSNLMDGLDFILYGCREATALKAFGIVLT